MPASSRTVRIEPTAITPVPVRPAASFTLAATVFAAAVVGIRKLVRVRGTLTDAFLHSATPLRTAPIHITGLADTGHRPGRSLVRRRTTRRKAHLLTAFDGFWRRGGSGPPAPCIRESRSDHRGCRRRRPPPRPRQPTWHPPHPCRRRQPRRFLLAFGRCWTAAAPGISLDLGPGVISSWLDSGSRTGEPAFSGGHRKAFDPAVYRLASRGRRRPCWMPWPGPLGHPAAPRAWKHRKQGATLRGRRAVFVRRVEAGTEGVLGLVVDDPGVDVVFERNTAKPRPCPPCVEVATRRRR